MVLSAWATLIFPATASAGYCDLVVNWDEHTIDACVREMKGEIETLQLELQAQEAENRLMRGNLCLLATELKTENSASIAEIACTELRAKAAAKKKPATGGKK
jgi:hypothetical protein